jgi:hypothetical protein
VLLVVTPEAASLLNDPAPTFAISAFGRLLSCFADGLHVVLMEPSAAKSIEVSSKFSEAQRAAAKHIRNRYSDYGSLTTKLAAHAKIVADGLHPQPDGDNWALPLRWLAATPLHASRCIGEDLNDTGLLQAAAQDHLDSSGLNAFCVRVHEVLGGGNNTHRVLSQEAIVNCQLCICIVDSDRKYPTAPLGAVAQACQAVTGVGAYCVLTTAGRTIENSIPWRLLDQVRAKPSGSPSEDLLALRQLEQSSTQHLDMKYGLCRWHLSENPNSDFTLYWQRVANTQQRAACCPAQCSAASVGDCRDHIHRGYGGNLLADVVSWLRSHVAPRRSVKYLPSPNDADWKRIGALVSAYGIGLMPRRI